MLTSTAHVTTRGRPFTAEEFARRWHFVAITVDAHPCDASCDAPEPYFDSAMYEFPRDLDRGRRSATAPAAVRRAIRLICPFSMTRARGHRRRHDVARAQLGLEGKVDDLFVFARAISPDEMRAYR